MKLFKVYWNICGEGTMLVEAEDIDLALEKALAGDTIEEKLIEWNFDGIEEIEEVE